MIASIDYYFNPEFISFDAERKTSCDKKLIFMVFHIQKNVKLPKKALFCPILTKMANFGPKNTKRPHGSP